MKQELDDKLCKTFPRVFRQRTGDPMQTAFCFGFECGDGWYDLLYKCASKIEREIVDMKKADPSTPDDELPCASQVKEKYGTLRFYMSFTSDAIEDIINEAEDESAITCEECGKPGYARDGGWVRTLCDSCEHERNNYKTVLEHEEV